MRTALASHIDIMLPQKLTRITPKMSDLEEYTQLMAEKKASSSVGESPSAQSKTPRKFTPRAGPGKASTPEHT